MASCKIAMIGGGSAFCPVFLNAIVQNAQNLEGSQVVLMDINQPNLEIIYNLGAQMFKSGGADIELVRTTDQAEAIANADFVITSFRPGGFEG